jgi:phage-related protein
MAGLVRATMDIEEAQKAANLSMDIAAAKGVSLETVTKAMERAYGGNMTALAKLSPELRQMIKDGASMEEVMAEMAVTFGGAATDSANTAAGSMKRLGVALGEAKEGVGAALLPILEKALPVLQSFATWAQDNPTLITAVAAAFGVMAASIVLVNAAMALNPAVLITAGIVALGVALVTAYKRFDTFRAVVNAVVNQVARNFEFMANAFITMINVVIKGINLIKPGKDIGSLGQISLGRLGGEGSAVGGANPAGLDYKAMATGGIVTSPTLALIGEAGPEAVIPLSKAGGMGMNITVNAGLVATPDQVGQDIIAAIQKAQRRSGTVFAPA